MDEPLDMLQIKIERAKDELPLETRKAIDSVDWRAFVLGMRERKGYSFEQLEDLELETELLLCGLSRPEDYPKELEKSMGIPKSQVDLLVNEMNEAIFKKIREELIKNTERKELFVKTPTLERIGVPTSPTKATENVGKENNLDKIEIPTPPENETGSNVKPSFLNEIGLKRTEDKEKSDSLKEKLKNLELSNTMNTAKDTEKDPAEKNLNESIFSQKLAGSFQIPTTRTEYTLNSMPKFSSAQIAPIIQKDSATLKTTKEDPYRMAPNE